MPYAMELLISPSLVEAGVGVEGKSAGASTGRDAKMVFFQFPPIRNSDADARLRILSSGLTTSCNCRIGQDGERDCPLLLTVILVANIRRVSRPKPNGDLVTIWLFTPMQSHSLMYDICSLLQEFLSPPLCGTVCNDAHPFELSKPQGGYA